MGTKNRDVTIDVLRGFAILLVVVGHSIQYGNGFNYLENKLFYENIVFIFIYTFHMPLFMLISGYLFAKSIKNKPLKELLYNRLSKILLPVLIWNAVFLSIRILWKTLIKNENFEIDTMLFQFINDSTNSLWFLWAIFYCSICVIIVRKAFKDNVYVYLLILIILVITPDWSNSHLYKFMYPYFVGGIFVSKKQHSNTL
jgi:fucose 4-O-acetylase-like acetyltransferase